MIGTDIRDLILDYTDQDTTGFPLAKMARFFNVQKNALCAQLEQINEGYFTMNQYRDLVAGQREYQLPVYMMNKIEKLYIKFPGWDKARLAREVLLSMQPWAMDEATIRTQYSDYDPCFLLRKNSIILLTASAIPDSPDGMELWAKMFPTDITTVTLNSGYDLAAPPSSVGIGIPANLHELICRKVSIMYKTTQDYPVPLNENEQKFQFDFEQIQEVMKNQNYERDIVARLPPVNDDGYIMRQDVQTFNPFSY